MSSKSSVPQAANFCLTGADVGQVEQIERFYAKHLPLSREMAKNLQSFGEE